LGPKDSSGLPGGLGGVRARGKRGHLHRHRGRRVSGARTAALKKIGAAARHPWDGDKCAPAPPFRPPSGHVRQRTVQETGRATSESEALKPGEGQKRARARLRRSSAHRRGEARPGRLERTHACARQTSCGSRAIQQLGPGPARDQLVYDRSRRTVAWPCRHGGGWSVPCHRDRH
jgi:hypothetical protein